MASESSCFNNMSVSDDIAASSSLTATASEFIPNSSAHYSFPKHISSSGKLSSNPPNTSPSAIVGGVQSSHQQIHHRRSSQESSPQSATRGRYFRRQNNRDSSSRIDSYRGHNERSYSNGSAGMQDGPLGRSTPRPAAQPSMKINEKSGASNNQKYFGGSQFVSQQPRRYDGSSQDSFGNDGGAPQGASALPESHFSGSQHRTYHRDFRTGFQKNWDSNGNRNQRRENSPYLDGKTRSRAHDDNYARDQSYEKSQKRECSKNHERDLDRGRERGRFWDRKHEYDREGEFNSDGGFSQMTAAQHHEHQADKNQDRFSSRPNRQGDYYSDRPRDGRNHNRDYGEEYYRDYDRGVNWRGNRQYFDINKNDQSQKRSHYQRNKGPNSFSNVNVRETFGSSSFNAHDGDTNWNSPNSSRNGYIYSANGSNLSGLKQFSIKDGDDASQRDRLTEQLTSGTLECLVCCERVRQPDSVWSCTNCYHVLHLRCVIKWAKSSKAETGWRCPACQNTTENIPTQYRCFCGKFLEPQWNRQDTPHACGEVCGKSRELRRPLCTHRCNLLCHPGPCPPCAAQVSRDCGCGKLSQIVKCGSDKPLLCESVCAKPLNCGTHTCSKSCHIGPCEPCSLKIEQNCYCEKQKREVDCNAENVGIVEFCCNETCARPLACGNHSCEAICHPGNCKPCELTPDAVTRCPCGKTELSSDPKHLRKSCRDPVPCCDKICGRSLHCGQPSLPHACRDKCHVGTCPACPFTTTVRCRCGHMDREIPCEQLTTKADDARCERKCTKKRSCGKHKCNQLCCIEVNHPCPLPCNHTLSCGLHRCDQLCHPGRCRPCWRTSFDELPCECGAAVLFPPVPCGTKPPVCSRPCSRRHDCDHEALHSCHSEPACPPCTFLTQKYCYGKHEMRKSIPCHQKEFSCGLPCNKELPCGRHKCILPCHKDECSRPGVVCTQPCNAPRATCQHCCSALCHSGPCPDVPCKENVRVTCECGHRSAQRPCAENAREYQRIATSLLASKMADVQLGHSIDIGDIMGNPSTKKMYLKSLECSDECKVIERNRRLAVGLQIRNPDLSSKLTPRYSDFMRNWAKKDPIFCQMVHDKLTELVKLAKESKQKSRSYSFEVMNGDKRQFVHEYCEHFGCESVAYDKEPKRNVVATAQKAKAWLPSFGLMELIQRESGQRRVPGPMLNSSKKPITRSMDCLPNKWASKPPVIGCSNTNADTSSSLTRTSSPQTASGPWNMVNMDGSSGSSANPPYIDHFNS